MNRIKKIKNNDCVESDSNKSIIFVPPDSPKVIVLDDSDDDEVDKGTEYFNEELNILIDMENAREWQEVDIKSDIKMIFIKLKGKFFGDKIDPAFNIYYDLNHAICDGSAFKILEKSKSIIVNQSTLVRPRIQQISMFLHILIHLYLNKVSDGKIGINKHDENFRSIMHYLNDRLYTSISINHKFGYNGDEQNFSKEWWVCSGICQNYSPFRGIIRSPIMPNETMIFWQLHHTKCSGTFFKIFEIRRRTSSDDVDKKYIRSPSYMNPQANDIHDKVTAKVQQVVKNQIREQVDLTEETERPIVKNLCDVIDLDESQYNIVENSTTYLQQFITMNLIVNENICPFCLNNITISRLAAHFDVCMGYQPEVQYSPSSFKISSMKIIRHFCHFCKNDMSRIVSIPKSIKMPIENYEEPEEWCLNFEKPSQVKPKAFISYCNQEVVGEAVGKEEACLYKNPEYFSYHPLTYYNIEEDLYCKRCRPQPSPFWRILFDQTCTDRLP